MSEPYEEIYHNQITWRLPPNPRHELICARLHAVVQASVANFSSTKLLAPRTAIRFGGHTTICPDLSLITTANQRLWLAAEIVNSGDHHPDTVEKKLIYETLKLPRLWMIDPRYDNIEVYVSTEYGMRLQEILAGRDLFTEKLLPEFQLSLTELFAAPPETE